MFPDLPYPEVIITGVFLVLVFFLSGEVTRWSGMRLEEIERRISAFKQEHCHGDFLAGYPMPLLVTDLTRYDGGVSWRRGLTFFCGNLAFAAVVFGIADHWVAFLFVLAPGLFVERTVLKQFATSRQQVYIEDMDACALYYKAHFRISGDLKWVMACSTAGRMADLRVQVCDSGVLPDGEYSLMVHIPEHLDGHYITYGRRAPFNVFKHPVSLFLCVRESAVRIDSHTAEVELHALYQGVLAPNTERDLRVALSFAHRVPPKNEVLPSQVSLAAVAEVTPLSQA